MANPITWTCTVAIQAAASGERLPTFEMLAYAGAPLKLGNINAPVVVDLSTLTSTASLPALRDHKISQQVGHVERLENDGRTLTASGVISSTSTYATEIVADHKNGFVWQCSIGADPGQLEFVARGERVTVNGQSHDGPVYVSRDTLLREISFTAVGADHHTTVAIAATAKPYLENQTMSFEQWVATLEMDPANLTETQREKLQEAFAQLQTVGDSQTTVTATRATSANEELRIAAVRRICGNNHDLASTAIAAGWSEQQTEGHVLRASRPASPSMAYYTGHDGDPGKAMEAALAISAGVPASRLVASYGERTIETAERKFRGINLHGVVRETLRAVGRPAGPGRIGQAQIADAFQADRQLRAAFSSSTLSGIVGNVASKILLDAFANVAGTWRSIAKIESNPDFKPAKRYRFTARGKLEEVAPDGKLKHVYLSEAEHDSELSTYGAIVQLSRKDIINDDLQAFAQLPQQFGRLAGIKLEKSLFELLLSNPSTFFGSGNSNYAEGSGTALSITSLTQAETLFMNQVDANGDPILVRPKTLLVPSTLAGTARVLCNSTQVVTGASSTLPANNPHAGNFEPVSTPWLEKTSITGYSAAAWYLFADPSQLAALEVAFLNGAESPIIEEGQPDFDQLGMTWRVVYDFGVRTRETAGAVKMKGSA
jgi:hypothetical protein